MVLRALFGGIGMGGEWASELRSWMEKVPARLRGVLSGLLQGYATGYLLAALYVTFVFPRWGWRPMFLHRRIADAAGVLPIQSERIGVWKKQSMNLGDNSAAAYHRTGIVHLSDAFTMMVISFHARNAGYVSDLLERHWGSIRMKEFSSPHFRWLAQLSEA